MSGKIKTKRKIMDRYANESKNSCNLSCGNNLIFLDLKKGEKVLDLGSGKGNDTISAALMVGKDGMAIGLDITQKMVEKATINAIEKKFTNAKFILGDIEDLPFTNDYFDAIMSNCVINHARDKKSVFLEIYRVLNNKGRFVISDAVTKKPLPDEIKNDPEAISQCFGGAIPENEYLNIIKEIGFKDIEILKRREYLKNGFDFISLTIKATKDKKGGELNEKSD
jgi:ubiquinone/menaquinone biosynthesis C-methylase UbiE